MLNLFEEIVKQASITHMDELKTDDFIRFVKNFIDLEHRNVEISEKVDGQNFSFGIDENDKFFSKTKTSAPVTDPSVYGEFSFMQGVKDFHNILANQTRTLLRIKQEVANLTGKGQFVMQIFGELLPSSETNIVKYDKEKIGNGAVVLFNVVVDGKSILQERWAKQVFDMLVRGLDNSGGWRVYNKFLVNPNKFKFEVNHLITLEDLYRKYYDILKSRKRADKATKDKAKRVIQMVMDNIKGQFLKQMVMNRKSFLGNIEPEGLILRDFSNNLLVKLVDKDSFTEANQAGSKYIKPVMVAVQATNRKIKDDIFGNADIMKNFAKVIEKSVDWAFTQKQKDPNFKVHSLNDILKVAYDDMVGEGRLKYSAKEAIKKTVSYLKEFHDIVVQNEKEMEKNKANMPESKYLISKEKMQAYKDTAKSTIAQLNAMNSSDGIRIYLTIIAFVFGKAKIRELKQQFNLNR